LNDHEAFLPGRHESGARTQLLVVFLGAVLLARVLLEAGSSGAPLLSPQPIWYLWPVILVLSALTFAAPIAALVTLLGLLRTLPDFAFAHGGSRAVSLGQAALNGTLAIALIWLFAVVLTT
jgi:hypothetical protein